MDFSAFPKSSTIDVVWYPVRNLATTLGILPNISSSSRITSFAIPSMLRSTLNSGSSFSRGDSVLHICFQMVGGSGFCWEYLVPLLAPVSWCPKQNSPMCLAAAAVVARHSRVLSSVQHEASRVFQIKFCLPFEKLLCRCNLPALSCCQVQHGIRFARTALLCLVLGQN